MKRAKVLLIIVFVIFLAFILYPRKFDNILDIQKNKIYRIKIDYDLLALSNSNEADSIIVIDDKDTILKITSVFGDYKYLRKILPIMHKPISTPFEKIHFRFFFYDDVMDMLTINEQGEIVIYTAQKGTKTYRIIGNKMKLFNDIKLLLGLKSIHE